MTTTAADQVELPPALDASTMCEVLTRTIADRGDAIAVRTPGGSTEISFADLGRRAAAVAAGLHQLGVRRGDTVGLMLVNRPEFHVVDAGAMLLGAAPFSVYNTSPPEQVGYVMGDAGNRVVITQPEFLDTVLAAREHGAVLEHVILVEGSADGALTLEQLEASGDGSFDVEAAWRAVQPDDLLTLIYTSGTTGPPKGVEITHANMLAELRGVHQALPDVDWSRGLSFLPSAHIADRWAAHYSTVSAYGGTVTCVADLTKIVPTCLEVRPTIFGGVPRIFEKIKAALEAAQPGIGDLARNDPAVAASVREKIGLDQVTHSLVGAAATPPEVHEFFLAIGIELCEVWGMSELSCVATTERPGEARVGSVGKPIPGVEVRLADDGELLVRGGTVMRAYRNLPDKTAETIDADGWLATGDIATIDADGTVAIVDRKKELIINAAGKNMSPANIESALKSSGPLIGQACVIGDNRPYNVALLILDPDTGAGLDPTDSEVVARVQAEVDAANAKLSRVEQIKRFRLLDAEWLPGGEELTPTMKLKRRPIGAKYAAEIEALYA